MKIISSKTISLNRKKEILSLWNNEYPDKLQYSSIQDFDNYLNSLSNIEHFLLINNIDKVVGWAMTFERENENWFAVIIDSTKQGKGYGKLLLDELKKTKPVLNGWVIDHENDIKTNGEPYKSPLGFYLKNGFQVLNDFRIENDKITAVKIRWSTV
ncbi:GNAT family N-acetyltransferase [Flavobacterium sp. H122]|uniref:GNAT family N-acetyltransferase n=1 Tax=Flavobacterium sp. H122 TaxID=2529860 RepID=UPI0010A9E8E0|nr:GNAT family N-acetyltransferase [Flavobacterium sp. H122]